MKRLIRRHASTLCISGQSTSTTTGTISISGKMGGPNLEILRFAMYLAVPTASILYFGDPEWYDRYVVPYGKKIWPDYETTHKPPKTQAEIQEQLAKFKAERLERKKAQVSAQQEGTGAQSGVDAAASAARSICSQLPDAPFESRPSQNAPPRLV